MIYVVLETLKFFLAAMFGVVICLFVQTFTDDVEEPVILKNEYYIVRESDGKIKGIEKTLEDAQRCKIACESLYDDEFFIEIGVIEK